ncbi:unnamed protein product, partial [Ixodes persulcatus]
SLSVPLAPAGDCRPPTAGPRQPLPVPPAPTCWPLPVLPVPSDDDLPPSTSAGCPSPPAPAGPCRGLPDPFGVLRQSPAGTSTGVRQPSTADAAAAICWTPSARSQGNGSHFTCPECSRAFSTSIGLSQHLRQAHPVAYNATINTARTKARWDPEETYLMPSLEAGIPSDCANINQTLCSLLPRGLQRTYEVVKAHRRQVAYRELVARIRAAHSNTSADTAAPGAGSRTRGGCAVLESRESQPPPPPPPQNEAWEVLRPH